MLGTDGYAPDAASTVDEAKKLVGVGQVTTKK